MEIFLTGDSHLGALKLAHDARVNSGSELASDISFKMCPLGTGLQLVAPYSRRGTGEVIIVRDAIRERIPSFPVDDIRTYGLCAPLHTARLMRHPGWNIYAPPGFKGNGLTAISTDQFRMLVVKDQVGNLRFLSAMKRAGLDVFVVEAPRPFRHHPAFERGLRTDVAIAVDRRYRQVMRYLLRRRGVDVIGVPPEVHDRAGFMLEEYAHGDAHHGNAAFGELMLQQIEQRVAALNEMPIAA